jgi:O-antigen/teichoic acid export membrane protein
MSGSVTAPNNRVTSFRTLGRQTAIYSVGVMLGRAVSFLMLPVYTRFLTPADYGLVQLLEITVEVAAIFFTAGATAGVQRFYFKANSADERQRLVSTAFFTVLALAAACTIVLLALSPALWHFALKEAGQPWFIRLASLNFALSFLLNFPLSFTQTTQRPVLFLVASTCKLVLQLSLNIYFVVVLRLGVVGLLWSTFITNLALGTVMTVWLLRQTGLQFDWAILRDLRRFGTPYQVSWAGSFILTFGDRFFLQAARGTTAVGLYSLAYQFGFLLVQLGSTPFLSAWNPHRHELAKFPRAERDRHFDTGFLYFNLLLITMATGIAVFIRPVIRTMTTPAFHAAAHIVPIILLAYTAQAWADALKFGIDISERTMLVTKATWATVVVVLLLYATLIPSFGAMGAAMATLAGSFFRAALLYRWSQREWRIEYSWRRPLLLVGIGANVSLAAFLLPDLPIVGLIGSGIVLMLIYFACVHTFILGLEERHLLRRLLSDPEGAWSFMTRRS